MSFGTCDDAYLALVISCDLQSSGCYSIPNRSLSGWRIISTGLSRYELYSTCNDDVSCLIEGAISGYIEPVQWWYQLIDDDDNNNDNVQR